MFQNKILHNITIASNSIRAIDFHRDLSDEIVADVIEKREIPAKIDSTHKSMKRRPDP